MSEEKKDGVDLKNNTTKIIVSVIVIIVFLLGISIGKNRNADKVNVEDEISGNELISDDTDASLVAEDGLIHPKAPGPWATGAVKNFLPAKFVVGENMITADVKGLFVEGVGTIKIYDNLTEIFSAEIKALPETDWVNSFVGIEPIKVTIPESLRGKTLIVRFLELDVDETGETKYFGQTIPVE